MRAAIITVRKRVIAAAPWLPWVVPAAAGAVDAIGAIDGLATGLHVGLTVAAATITAIVQIPRALAARWERAAHQAQIQEAVVLAYRMAAEHCETHRIAEEIPQAVGAETTIPIPALHVVRETDEVPAARVQMYRRKTTVGRATVPGQASRPQQPDRPARLASGSRQQRQP